MPPVRSSLCAMAAPFILLAACSGAATSGTGGSGPGPGGAGGSAGASTEPAIGPLAFRRLTSDQYASSIHDVLGQAIDVPERIDEDDRRAGLNAVGATFAGITASAFEKYEAAARDIASQALGPALRDSTLPCEPASDTAADDDCAKWFIESTGGRLFRRPLTDDELSTRVALAREATETLGDFYRGLELSLASLLSSPHFLFRVELAEPDPANPEQQRVTAHTIASRLSYLLWNTTPDDTLLDMAESGALYERDVLTAEVERMLASERLQAGTRSFFTDVYDFSSFDRGLVSKDSVLFPSFTEALAVEAKEQTLRTIVAHLAADQDYRDLFTTRDTFVTPMLAELYGDSSDPGWRPYELDPAGPRAGILSHASFMSLLAHPGRSSPTLRGKFVREVLLCQDIPTPPADIDFSIVEDVNGELRTARERLDAHVSNEGCARCHNLTDPIGLAFENFDAIGAYRLRENGVTIDASGELDGVDYDDAVGLSQALRAHPSLGSCLAQTMYRYALGRDATPAEWALLDELAQKFAAADYRVSTLVEEIVLSESFLRTTGPLEAVVIDSEEVP